MISINELWTDSKMAETVAEAPGLGRDSGLPSDVRFLASSVDVVGRRLRRAESSSDPDEFAVFVLKPMGRNDPAVSGYDLVWRLDEAATALSGRLWLTNEGLNFGHSIPDIPGEAGLVEWIVDDLSLGDYPTVIFDPSVDGGRLRYYANGLCDLAEVRSYGICDLHAITLEEVQGVVDFVVEHSLITPQQQISNSSTWANAPKYWVASNAEAVIQSQICIALKKEWPACDVKHEIPVKAGRFDLAVTYCEPNAGTWTFYGVLELKVLKDLSNTGRTTYTLAQNQEWVNDGASQAASYRTDVGAAWAMLCCFDHRKDEDQGQEYRARVPAGDPRGVEVCRWRLMNSSDQLRV